MHTEIILNQFMETDEGTILMITVPNKKLGDMLIRKHIKKAEIRFDDGRHISAEQRRKAYATIRDISDYTGYLPEEQKEWLKYLYIIRTGNDWFSLSTCTMDTAREFISVILEYALAEGIPLSEEAINRTDDIGRYLYFCLVYKRCAICGKSGEIHHVDAIGMGNDRKTVDDSNHRKICLCRIHHGIAHQRGMEEFKKMYKVYGIIAKDVGGGSCENCYTNSTNYKKESPADCKSKKQTNGDTK